MADRLATDHHPGQVVVVCGTNEKIREALENYSWPEKGSGVTVKILGFVSNMDEWMAASDLLVTKVLSSIIFISTSRYLLLVCLQFPTCS